MTAGRAMNGRRTDVFSVDLHSHSYGSPDGGLSLQAYRWALESGRLDYIAITDHGQIETAQQIKTQLGALGERIIIGQEIMTSAGEIIGLYLTRTVPSLLSPLETVRHIRDQGGLVYIPHPFETVRSGMTVAMLDTIAPYVDVIEGYNGRALFQNRGVQARAWAARHGVAVAASSDAHGRMGWCRTYSVLAGLPTADSLVAQLCQAGYATRSVRGGILYPKFNRISRRLRPARRADKEMVDGTV